MSDRVVMDAEKAIVIIGELEARAEAAESALFEAREALREMCDAADRTKGGMNQHSANGRMQALAALGKRLEERARTALETTPTEPPESEGRE
jgi:hypothetical protein